MVPDVQALIGEDVLLPLADEAPDLIDLKQLAGKIPHALIEEPVTSSPDALHQSKDGIAVNAGHTLDATDAGALNEGREDCHLLFPLQHVHGLAPVIQGGPCYTERGTHRAPAAQPLECGLPLRHRDSGVGGLLRARCGSAEGGDLNPRTVCAHGLSAPNRLRSTGLCHSSAPTFNCLSHPEAFALDPAGIGTTFAWFRLTSPGQSRETSQGAIRQLMGAES